MTGPLIRPVYKALHKPLTFGGVDRRLFFLTLMLGAVAFNLLYSFVTGILVFALMYGLALATRQDPRSLPILLSARRYRTRYDAAKHDAVAVRPC